MEEGDSSGVSVGLFFQPGQSPSRDKSSGLTASVMWAGMCARVCTWGVKQRHVGLVRVSLSN